MSKPAVKRSMRQSDSTGDSLYRMTPLELAAGYVFCTVPVSDELPQGVGSPLEELERSLLPALSRPPCVVAFSGGRDSSALLAVAVAVARRHGLPTPLPATRSFPGDRSAEESQWQTQVIRHLRIDDWVRLEMTDECDLIGPFARRVLRRHGLVWPPAAYVNIPMYRVARGGTLVTGEGGDEVFGLRRARIARHLLGGPRRSLRVVRHAPGVLGPGPVRSLVQRRALRTNRLPWLRESAWMAVLEQLVKDSTDEPLNWSASGLRLRARRVWIHAAATRQRLADDDDVVLHEPLLGHRFLVALGNSSHALGPLSRTAIMRELFGDLLPAGVVERRTKASFNTVIVNRSSREFAEGWNGDGVDHSLVDPSVLRSTWLSSVPHACSFGLLQAAWLRSDATP